MWYKHRPFVKAIGENPSQWRGGHWWGERRRANHRRPLPLLLPCIPWWWESCWNCQKEPPPACGWTWGRWWWESRRNRWKEPPPACIWMRGRWWWESRRNDENDHLRLAFGCEGGGGGGRRVETPKKTTSGLRLNAREVEVVGGVLEERKWPPPARVWMWGRWWWEAHRNCEMNHLQLAFQCEGDGGGWMHVETTKWTIPGSHLDMREVVVVGVASKCRNQPPPARIWTRGRWWW